MNIQATSRPWRVEYDAINSAIVYAGDTEVFTLVMPNGGHDTTALDKANIDLFIRAVNAHDAARKALEAVQRFGRVQPHVGLGDSAGYPGIDPMPKVRAALAVPARKGRA